nr:hypothetical protein [Rhodoferax sp.]
MQKTVVQNILAPVYGHVAGGDITVVEHPPQEREPTWWDLNSAELRTYLQAARAERWSAWRRYWFNPPFFLVGLYCLGLLSWAWSMISNGHTTQSFVGPMVTSFPPFWIVMFSCVLMLPLVYWLQRIRRIEVHVAAHAQADIDAIELVLRRRKE